MTGGAKRLGAEIFSKLADEGCNVVIHYNRSESQAMEMAERCRSKGVMAETLQGDLMIVWPPPLDFAKRYVQKFSDTRYLINPGQLFG